MRAQLTKVSGNSKTGRIPVSITSRDTCPQSCPLLGAGCYADTGPLGMHWGKVSAGERGTDNWREFCDSIRALPRGQIWRHNQAGDLPGKGNRIDPAKLRALVDANQGRRGFTYTHKPVTAANVRAIRDANDRGFTVNLSANNLEHADQLADTGLPTVTVLPSDASGTIRTPSGRRVAICPAVTRSDMNCANCGICAIRDRRQIIGFPAHGNSKRKASAIAQGSA